jgi:cytochrome c oxidase assembly protein subunit 15
MVCRLLGVGFAVPGAYFLARGFINGALGRRLGLLFMMGGAQGLVGWWMVRSGLKVREELSLNPEPYSPKPPRLRA